MRLIKLILFLLLSASVQAQTYTIVIERSSGCVEYPPVNDTLTSTNGEVPIEVIAPTGGAQVAIGVFDTQGRKLKSVIENTRFEAGTDTVYWDGTDDDGLKMPAGSYRIKIDQSKIVFTWEGVIGNTSEYFTGPTIHRAFLPISSMAFSDTAGLYCTNYNELGMSQNRFSTNHNQRRYDVYTAQKGQNTAFVATDGTNAYWAGDGNGESRFYVVATRLSDNREVIFPSGVPIQGYTKPADRAGETGDMAIGVRSASIGGLAVNAALHYLFVSHYSTNTVDVISTTSGAIVQTITVTQPGRLACDAANNLYVVTSNDVKKYPINSDGTLAASTLTITGTVLPQSIAVSPDNATLIVAYGEPQHLVKAFNTTSGASAWNLGTAGGYATDPAVKNTKFDLTGSYLAFQADGSFWVGDVINYRTLHFSASRSFIDYIMYIPAVYKITVDENDPKRVFANGYLEFTTDYSKPLAPNNGSWSLARNYKKFFPDGEGVMQCLTMSNGRTYIFCNKNVSTDPYNTRYVIKELMPTGPPRDCGNYDAYNFGFGSTQVYPDGSMRQSYSFANVPHEWRTSLLTGFSTSNNPIWQTTQTLLAKTPPINTAIDPWSSGIHLTAGEKTTGTPGGDIYITYNPATPETDNKYQRHLGAVRAGDSSWLWKDAPNTFKAYQGPFPTNGYQDIGNNVNVYGGSVAFARDRFIVWSFHGEFWKYAQCNWFQWLLDDGLMIGQFGANPDANSPAGMGGNTFSQSLVKRTGDYYLFHNDESYHAGVHRWKISNTSSVTETTQNYTLIQNDPGLLQENFEGSDLNNFYNKTHLVTPTVNLTSQPSGVSSTYSVRWRGFVVPQYSQTYTFYTSVTKGVKLFVNDSLIISNWANASSNEFTSSIPLQAGKGYKIKMEVGGGTASLSWSSSSQAKQIIPSDKLLAGKVAPATDGVDLLEEVPHRTTLENGIYGWTSTQPYNISGIGGEQLWRVQTGNSNYRLDKSTDLAFSYGENISPSMERISSRNLGDSVTTNWRLDAMMHYQYDFPNEGNGGQWMEILDNNDKVIANFWNGIYFDSVGHDRPIYFNDTLFHYEPERTALSILWNSNLVRIEGSATAIKLTYGPYSTVVRHTLDPTANWRRPTTLRYRFRGWKYSRRQETQSLFFRKDYSIP